ncbi:MAG: LOG family protein [Bdellovibrionota bacterium]
MVDSSNNSSNNSNNNNSNIDENSKNGFRVAERNPSSAYKKFRKQSKEDDGKITNSDIKKHLDERLRFLHQRAMIIEDKMLKLDEGRFFRACVFGSARIKAGDPVYDMVFELARLLAREGIDVLTGGGPGLMEAGNYGAEIGQQENNTRSLSFGLPIQLEFEPDPNIHLDVRRHHYRFSHRLDDFMRLSNIVICTPGGIGTLLELFFSWQLVQVKHIAMRPIILLDKSYWQGLLDWMHAEPNRRKLISDKDFDFVHLVDTPAEAMEIVKDEHQKFLEKKKV